MRIPRAFAPFVVCVASMLLLASAVQAQTPCSVPTTPDVTTWHYDNCRTGWQQNETVLNTTTVNANGTFGKIFQYNVQGAVYAQPLALYNVSQMVSSSCPSPCNVVFVATQQDMLYAFNADNPAQLWSLDLAAQAGGTFANCFSTLIPPCANGVIYPDLGVTSTPVIDRSAGILYVVSFVNLPLAPNDVGYFIHAVDIYTGQEEPGSPSAILPTYSGQSPSNQCGTATGTGTLLFEASGHYQRSGLLLVNGEVYVAFSSAGKEELPNGWILGFSYNSSAQSLNLDYTYVTTPYGTGGGVWMDGAGLSAVTESDGNTYLYVSVANGTFDVSGPVQITSTDYRDSILKMKLLATVNDYFTPADALDGQGNQVRCEGDDDLGSGGLMAFPDVFFSGKSLLIAADKESKFYIADRNNLTHYNYPVDRIVEEFMTNPKGLGYWGSPAYWEWTNQGQASRAIYYSVNAAVSNGNVTDNAPLPMNMYLLNSTNPPVPNNPTYSTVTDFCGYGAQPSVSSQTSGMNNGVAGTGVVWAYEDQNLNNPQNCELLKGQKNLPAALHAYDASNLGNGMTELYDSRGLTSVSYPVKFATPMVFNGKVYIGTQANTANGGGYGQEQTEVDVFGICNKAAYPPCVQQ